MQDSPEFKGQLISRALNIRKVKESFKYLTAHKISSLFYKSRL